MVDQGSEATNKFGIEVQGVELPEEIKKRIATELQEVVLRNLARIDNGPKAKIGPKQEDFYVMPVFDKYWYGLIAKYLARYQEERVKDLGPGDILDPKFSAKSIG